MANVQHNSLTGTDLHVAGPVTVDLDLTDQASDPASPASGHHAFYAKAGGAYLKTSAGVVSRRVTRSRPLPNGAPAASQARTVS